MVTDTFSSSALLRIVRRASYILLLTSSPQYTEELSATVYASCIPHYTIYGASVAQSLRAGVSHMRATGYTRELADRK